MFLWFLVIFFHRQKNRFTLIPLYSYLAILTLLTHNLSDLGFAVTVNQWYFLISSFSFFTALMLGILFIYLFEGPRATRLAISIIVFVSFFYIGLVFLLNMQADTSKWVVLTFDHLKYYFFSISAIVIDVFFITIVWELLEKLNKIPLLLRLFIIIFGTYLLDTLIFVTGIFGSQSMYVSVLQGNLTIRFILALIATPIAHSYLKEEKYSAKTRNKPQVIWEILNFRSDLESKIQTMAEIIKHEDELKRALEESQETYRLAIEGANAGIWDWDMRRDGIMFSPKFCALLGYKEGTIPTSIEGFKTLIHPDDIKRVFDLLETSFKKKETYLVEYRLRTQDGTYKWYLCGGTTKYDQSDKPIRMVGSIIDINEKKELLKSYEEKVFELEKFNKLMVDRESQMIALKKEIEQLKNK
jgi:PAS domain S-box-containing protein